MLTSLGASGPDVYQWLTWIALALLLSSLGWRQRNIPALAARVARLEELSTRDVLTGLLNGRYLDLIALPEALRAHPRTCLIECDLDDFKAMNSLGHRDGGDRALCIAAEALTSACRRGTDRVFRLYTAGDEFLLLLPGASPRVARHIARQALAALRREGLSASFGLVCADRAHPLPQAELLRAANALMHQAKRAGKGRIAQMGPQGQVVLAADEDDDAADGRLQTAPEVEVRHG